MGQSLESLRSANDFSYRLQLELTEGVEMDRESSAGGSADSCRERHGRSPAEAHRNPDIRASRGILLALDVHPARSDITTPAGGLSPFP